MGDFVTQSGIREWRKALTSASTSASFTTLSEQVVPTDAGLVQAVPGSGPSGTLINCAGTFKISEDYRQVDSILVVRPYGSDTDDETFSLRVWGWNVYNTGLTFGPVLTVTKGGLVYVPTLLAQVACTLGTGVPSSRIESGMLWVDLITRTYGDSGINIISPATDGLNNVPASFMIDLRGSQWVTLDFAINSGTAVSMNALWKLLT